MSDERNYFANQVIQGLGCLAVLGILVLLFVFIVGSVIHDDLKQLRLAVEAYQGIER